MAPWVNKNKVQSNYCVLKVIFNLLYLKNYEYKYFKGIFEKNMFLHSCVLCVCVLT